MSGATVNDVGKMYKPETLKFNNRTGEVVYIAKWLDLGMACDSLFDPEYPKMIKIPGNHEYRLEDLELFLVDMQADRYGTNNCHELATYYGLLQGFHSVEQEVQQTGEQLLVGYEKDTDGKYKAVGPKGIGTNVVRGRMLMTVRENIKAELISSTPIIYEGESYTFNGTTDDLAYETGIETKAIPHPLKKYDDILFTVNEATDITPWPIMSKDFQTAGTWVYLGYKIQSMCRQYHILQHTFMATAGLFPGASSYLIKNCYWRDFEDKLDTSTSPATLTRVFKDTLSSVPVYLQAGGSSPSGVTAKWASAFSAKYIGG